MQFLNILYVCRGEYPAMLKINDLRHVRAVYHKTRHIWFADNLLDAHERLGLITVAARLRRFAFLNHLEPSAREQTAVYLSALGFQSHVLNARFDISIEVQNVSAKSTEAYGTAKKKERFLGLGVWLSNNKAPKALTLTQLGMALGYPQCCVEMDVQTKKEEHRLSLHGLIEEFGDDPTQIIKALKQGYPIEKPYSFLQEWGRRFESTMAAFPFVLHTACDACLRNANSPSATLNTVYEQLAKRVSDELHFLVRWAAHVICNRHE